MGDSAFVGVVLPEDGVNSGGATATFRVGGVCYFDPFPVHVWERVDDAAPKEMVLFAILRFANLADNDLIDGSQDRPPVNRLNIEPSFPIDVLLAFAAVANFCE